jgi:hypothetical protein
MLEEIDVPGASARLETWACNGAQTPWCAVRTRREHLPRAHAPPPHEFPYSERDMNNRIIAADSNEQAVAE